MNERNIPSFPLPTTMDAPTLQLPWSGPASPIQVVFGGFGALLALAIVTLFPTLLSWFLFESDYRLLVRLHQLSNKSDDLTRRISE